MRTLTLPQIGLQHPRIRQLRHVINNTAPNHRRLFVAEGLWAHNILLDLGATVDLFLWCPESAYSDEAVRRGAEVAARASSAYRVSPKVLERICDRERPDGLVSLVRLPIWPADIDLASDATVLVADAIEIPGNLGTMLRTVDACGGSALLLTNRRTRLSHPKVFRGSRGMSLRVPVLDFDRPERGHRPGCATAGFRTYLATVGPDALHLRGRLRRADRAGSSATSGTASPAVARIGLPRITIPMRGRADSLNVSVSASILLYAVPSSALTVEPAASPADRGSGSGDLDGVEKRFFVVASVVSLPVDEERRRAGDTAQVGGVDVLRDPRGDTRGA